jgi:hypothetical protein
MRPAQELGETSGNEFASQFSAGLLVAVLFVQEKLEKAADLGRRGELKQQLSHASAVFILA